MDQYSNINISERQRFILSIIVEDYVSTARPVASDQLVNRHDLNVSSATVRNDMVELERVGLIMQPHTSAGRVPSELGYRYFVANLMAPMTLPADEQRMIRHQFHQVEMDAEEWVRLATAVLARSVHSAAVATAPRSSAVHLKHFELLSISDERVLLVLVGHEGSVTQQALTVEESPDQEKLSLLAARLNGVLEGKTAAEVSAWASDDANVKPLPKIGPKVLQTLTTMLARLEKPDASDIYHEGLVHMLEQPEFRQPEKMQQVLELFERGGLWSSIIPSVINQEGVQVIIGDGRLGEGIAACGVVVARYGLEDKLSGVLGVIGPMRMPYSRSISTVQYMSKLLSDLLRRAYEPEGNVKRET